eukprot:NODE_3522_length_659_cov_950.640984_g2344_i2.p1 GENE.NODE_3522_length_659_cov_950.640984_g2344_i2~~NODE_3522_length_659_cov_950.640984_g2344_i2.p1  ORF type:complete len:219 (+),score=75.91 NODE_3522_length_659_cov_950.640984_g2344_i2:46-657(+)
MIYENRGQAMRLQLRCRPCGCRSEACLSDDDVNADADDGLGVVVNGSDLAGDGAGRGQVGDMDAHGNAQGTSVLGAGPESQLDGGQVQREGDGVITAEVMGVVNGTNASNEGVEGVGAGGNGGLQGAIGLDGEVSASGRVLGRPRDRRDLAIAARGGAVTPLDRDGLRGSKRDQNKEANGNSLHCVRNSKKNRHSESVPCTLR